VDSSDVSATTTDTSNDGSHPGGRADPDVSTPDRALGSPNLASLIHTRRKHLRLSLHQLAERVNCAKSYISMIETGSRGDGSSPSGHVGTDLLIRLEAALELPLGTLTRAAQWSATPPGVRREVNGIHAQQHAAAAQLRALLSEGSLDETFKRGRLRALVSRLEGRTSSNLELDANSSTPPPSSANIANSANLANTANISAPRPRLLPIQVPLINSVAAGYPREFTDLGYPARVADEYILSPDVDDPDAFAARVVGDSMQPLYHEGDIVVFSPNRPVKSGMDCFIRLERDSETTFKRVILETEGDKDGAPIQLIALNPLYGQRTIPREDVAFMCPAVSVTRRIT
jgi:repressor LexA